jgi:hypothetical protein
VLGIGAARVPSAEPAALCIPILMDCSTPAPTQTPTPTPTTTTSPSPSPTPSSPLLPSVPGITVPGVTAPGSTAPGSTPPDAASTAIADAIADPDAPVLTLPAAQLGGSSISIVGPQSISVVTVPLANGTRTPVLKLVADDIVIDDFTLEVGAGTPHPLLTTSDRMELRGRVVVYLDSATATLGDGTPITFGAATPPPGDQLPASLLTVHLGLVGVTAEIITFAAAHQAIK